jgi:hypothetical protein
MAILALVQTYRHRRKNRHEQLLAELRRADPTEHSRLLSEITDDSVRKSLGAAITKEGVVAVQGDVERFPFPESFRQFVNRRYWLRWALCAAALAGAGGIKQSSLFWSVVLLITGAILLIGVWRSSRIHEALQTVLLVSPLGVTELWPDGWQQTVLFNAGVESTAVEHGLVVSSATSGASIFLSEHRIGFDRLLELCRKHSNLEMLRTGDRSANTR